MSAAAANDRRLVRRSGNDRAGDEGGRREPPAVELAVAGPVMTIAAMAVEVVVVAASVEIAAAAMIAPVATPIALGHPGPGVGPHGFRPDHGVRVHLDANDAVAALDVSDRKRRGGERSGGGESEAGREGYGANPGQLSFHRRCPLSVNVPGLGTVAIADGSERTERTSDIAARQWSRSGRARGDGTPGGRPADKRGSAVSPMPFFG